MPLMTRLKREVTAAVDWGAVVSVVVTLMSDPSFVTVAFPLIHTLFIIRCVTNVPDRAPKSKLPRPMSTDIICDVCESTVHVIRGGAVSLGSVLTMVVVLLLANSIATASLVTITTTRQLKAKIRVKGKFKIFIAGVCLGFSRAIYLSLEKV